MNSAKTISPADPRHGESGEVVPSQRGPRVIGARGPQLTTFESLPIGGRFRLPGIVFGPAHVYVKTGELSYGLHIDEALWGWNDAAPFVEVAE